MFSPHGRVPSNLRDALRTATNADVGSRVAPDTNQWGLPYGNFPIGTFEAFFRIYMIWNLMLYIGIESSTEPLSNR